MQAIHQKQQRNEAQLNAVPHSFTQLELRAAPARSKGQLPKGFLLLTGIPPGMVVEGEGCWGFALEAAGLTVADGAGGEAADDEWWISLDHSR